MLVMSMAAAAASAAQVEISENAAETPAEIGADGGADTGADTGADGGADTSAGGNKIYFDANTSGWNNFSLVMVYIYIPATDEKLVEWGSKKKGGMTDEGSGIWSFDFDAKGHTIDPNTQYCVIFLNDIGLQTCDLLFDSQSMGDTAVCTADEFYENTDDSNKRSTVVRWKSGHLGPKKAVTSLGHIVGEVVPAFTSPYKMFVDFIANSGAKSLANAILYGGGKTAQELIDETAANLGLMKGDVKQAIAEAAQPDPTGVRTETHDWSKDWDESKSTLPDGENSDSHNKGDGTTDDSAGNSGSGSGSDSGSGSGSGSGSSSGSGSGSSSSGSSSSSSSSGSSSGSSTSGSGSGSKTGQETTVIFIMLGVMVAAAGTIFFIRKKDRT